MIKNGFLFFLLSFIFISCGGNPPNEFNFHNKTTPTQIESNNDESDSDSTTSGFSNSQSLKIMSYNVQAIPCFKTKSLFQKLVVKIYGKKCPVDNWYTRNTLKRIRAIKKRILNMGENSPDIILFQEVFLSQSNLFEDQAQLELSNIPGYDYIAWGPSAKRLNLDISFSKVVLKDIMNSGLLILSKYPLITNEYREMYYRRCDLNDCNSSKGAMKVQIQVPGQLTPLSLDIINTHLQADYRARYDQIRIDQLDDLQNFYSVVKKSSLQILAGDMNFRYTDNYESDEYFHRIFYGFKDTLLECQEEEKCQYTQATINKEKNGEILDHIFFNQRFGDSTINLTKSGTLDFKIGNKQMSDHKPVFSKFKIAW